MLKVKAPGPTTGASAGRRTPGVRMDGERYRLAWLDERHAQTNQQLVGPATEATISRPELNICRLALPDIANLHATDRRPSSMPSQLAYAKLVVQPVQRRRAGRGQSV
jgi:hypothetical protein